MQTAHTANRKLRILLIEDNLGDARLIRERLADPAGVAFELSHADCLTAGLERLTRDAFDVVLLDLSLPDSAGLNTFARVQGTAPEVPIIVMSGLDDENLAIQTVHEGAQDYLVKAHVDERLLVRSIRYAIERKHSEELLAHERDLFHTLMDNIPDRIYFKDQESRFFRINQAVAAQFRIAHPREAVGRTDRDFFRAEHAEAALADERRVMETGEPIIGKVERETLPDGSITWALTSKLPLKDKEGAIVGVFGISRDITALKQTEDALQSERNLLRSLIDNLPDYIFIKDRRGRYVLDNIAHRRLVGVTTEAEIENKTAADFFPPDVASLIAQDDRVVLEEGRMLLNKEELVSMRPSYTRWHATTKVPLRDASGAVAGLVGIARDITQRKQFEERLQRANAELARSQAEVQNTLRQLQRSHEELKTAQSQLIEAEKMQSVGRLAAGVAHEVKNPLGILRMGVDYLAKNVHTSDENVALIVRDMADAIERANSIIMGLLDFSVPYALDARADNLNTVVEQSLALVRHEISDADPPIRLVRELDPNLPSVWLDRNKMKQVFVNLLLNAVHAMPDGGTLTLRSQARQLRPEEVNPDAGSRFADRIRVGDTVVIAEVLDTGHGIPEQKLARIFEPFFTTKPTGQGTGLGLAVTRKIVELHNGSIEIHNRKEGGVIVTLMLKV